MKKLFIVGIAALLLVVFTVPAMAKVKIGGIIFTDFYYLDRNKDSSAFWRSGNGDTSFGNTAIQVPDITRVYARWNNEDNVGMYIELGIGDDSGRNTYSKSGQPVQYVSSVGVNVRHAYGWWDVTPAFRIMAGKSTTPLSPLGPNQLVGTRSGSLNVGAPGYGDLYSGRVAQVRGVFKFSKAVRLEVALVDPNGILALGQYGPWGNLNVGYQTNTKIPRIDVGCPIYVGPVSLYPSAMYQYRTVDLTGASGNDNAVVTYVGSLGAKAGFGPFGISVEGNYGQNWGNSWGNAGGSYPTRISSAFLNTTTNDIEDAKTYSFWVDASYKFGVITPHLMYGQEKTESKTMQGTACVDSDGKSSFWGISVPIDLAKGFRVRPEITFWDDGETEIAGTDSTNLGKYSIYGVQFQITF